MHELEPYSTTLPVKRARSMAYDGCHYYLTSPQLCDCSCNIHKLNSRFHQVDIISATRPYTCLCYDSAERCFWASCDNNAAYIYKLTADFIETDRISIANAATPVRSISHDCAHNTLIVAYDDHIAEVLAHRTSRT